MRMACTSSSEMRFCKTAEPSGPAQALCVARPAVEAPREMQAPLSFLQCSKSRKGKRFLRRCAGHFLPRQAVRKALVHEMVNSSLTHGVRTQANMRKAN